MNIFVKEPHRADFWTDHSNGQDTSQLEEFWSMGQFKPKCEPGDPIMFWFDEQLVARARVSRITKPGEVKCEHSGGFARGWKVHWAWDSFEDLRGHVITCLRVVG